MAQMSENWIIFLISQAVVIMAGLVAIYVRVNVKMAELEIRMKVSENRLGDVEEADIKINDKLDSIIEKINRIHIEIQNKVNR
jgi:peptidoglycan hydrolase CwlO-like protein